MTQPKIDIHINLAGVGTQNSGCATTSDFRRRYTFVFLKKMFGITQQQMKTSIDQDWAKMIQDLIDTSGVDYGVVLGFDDVYTPETRRKDPKQSQMVIPPQWVFASCQQHPGLLPGPGINPYRPDAIETLDWCVDQGACLLKWLPPAQNIDTSDPFLRSFYTRMAHHQLPLLVHTGGERTFKSVNKDFGDVRRLRLALECGVKVIAAHTATYTLGAFEKNHLPDLLKMLDEFPNLWVDNSGLCNPGRFIHLPKLVKHPKVLERTLYGSDWPIPTNSFYYLPQLGFKKVRELERIKNMIDRDIAIKQEFGYPDETLTKANDVLINLERWQKE